MSPSRSNTFSRPLDAGSVFVALLALRIANALTLRTFFQPDEYYQALEPAWQIAFGQESGAWITWEWHNRLRSSLHPAIFACTYAVLSTICHTFHCSVAIRSEVLIAGPRIIQALFAAITDWCTWRLACTIYETSSVEASWATLALTICSPWQWFCSTRTFSNSLETTLTVSALSLWPWHLLDAQKRDRRSSVLASGDSSIEASWLDNIQNLRCSLGLAALACILRPTNIIIWLCVSIPTLLSANLHNRLVLFSQSVICGLVALLISSIFDRKYYDTWTFPPIRFLNFNITRSLAVFYGANRRDYYLTEGLPLLLASALPFAIVGTWNALFKLKTSKTRASKTAKRYEKAQSKETEVEIPERRDHSNINFGALCVLAWTCIIFLSVLSCIAHKEVRFIYPILPLLHVLAGGPLALFAASSTFVSSLFFIPSRSSRNSFSIVFLVLITFNVILGYYVSQVHQRGVVGVMHQLRKIHEVKLAAATNSFASSSDHNIAATAIATTNNDVVTSFAVLMPCHSTPWRSYLVHPGLRGWALTCEPPVDIPIEDRAGYLDEADQFYADPLAWLQENLSENTADLADNQLINNPENDAYQFGEVRLRRWPSLFVMFAQLEDILGQTLQHKGYKRCWRAFNTHWHDDWRRNGDVVIWCSTDPKG